MSSSFVAIAPTLVSATSATGATWLSGSLISGSFASITTNGAQLFVAVGFDGTHGLAATSPDGRTWTQRAITSILFGYNSVAWNGSVFIAVPSSGTVGSISSDGITWTSITMPSPATSWIVVAMGATFCIVSASGSVSHTSTNNGVTWSASGSMFSGAYDSVAYNGTTVVAISRGGGGSGNIEVSSDGINWTLHAGISSSVEYIMTSDGAGNFIAVGTNVARTSTNGFTWTAQTIPAGAYTAAAWNGSVYCAIGTGTAAATSPDGVTWTVQAMPSSQSWSAITAGPLGVASTAEEDYWSSGLLSKNVLPGSIAFTQFDNDTFPTPVIGAPVIRVQAIDVGFQFSTSNLLVF